jgi:hypothetical protein
MARTLAEKAIDSNKTNTTYVAVEQPKDSYYAQKKMDMGVTGRDSKVFSKKRFQHIEAIHVIPTSRSMYYKARSLNLPHYMLTKSALQRLMKFVEPDNIQIILYDNSQPAMGRKRDRLATDRPATDRPAMDGPATDGPATDGLATEGLATDGLATDGHGAVRKRDDRVIGADPFLHVEHDPQSTPDYLEQCEVKKLPAFLIHSSSVNWRSRFLRTAQVIPTVTIFDSTLASPPTKAVTNAPTMESLSLVLKKPPSSDKNICQDLCQEAMASFSCFALSSYKAGKEVVDEIEKETHAVCRNDA